MIEQNAISDGLNVALSRARDMSNGVGMVGYGVAVVTGADGVVKQVVPFANLVTTAGDQYYAQKGIVGIAPANASAPSPVTGMKLGTSTTAAAKSGGGAALGAYITGSNVAFDTGYPTASAVAGTDTGWQATYQTTWNAGVATNTGITEVVIVTDRASDATSSAANSISRAVITSVNKGASDILTITWNHKFLGS